MDLDTFAKLGEAFGGLAIFVSLLYVAIELRLNTKNVRASTSYMGAHSWPEFNEKVTSDPEWLALINRANNNDQVFSGDELLRLKMTGRCLMERLDGLYYLYRNGLLDRELWDVRITWARRFIATPFWAEWWKVEREMSNCSPSFVALLEGQPSDGGPIV
jgi:hypothetical protein